MSSTSRKKQQFPILQAHQISFEQQPPERYYSPNEQARINAEQEQLRHAKNQYQRPKQPSRAPPTGPPPTDRQNTRESHSSEESDSATDPDIEKEEEIARKRQQPSKQKSTRNTDEEHDDGKEDKGLLSKIAEKTKEAIGLKKDEQKLKNTKITIELPRDILTAFFLLRLPRDKSRGVDPKTLRRDQAYPQPPYYDEYELYGKVCLWLAVLVPYFIQYYVLITLLKELADLWDELNTSRNRIGEDIWFNTTAFSVLFLYMWKDLASFYYSVWYYIKYLQDRAGGITKNLTHAVSAGAEITKVKTHVNDESHVSVADAATEAVEEVKVAVKFIEFRLWLLSVVVLYVGLTVYSLFSIPLAETLVDKLEVSLGIFFILEVDDWAYELFIAQANFLEDAEFDVEIVVKKDRKGVVKRQQKQLLYTLILVFGSMFVFWTLFPVVAWLQSL